MKIKKNLFRTTMYLLVAGVLLFSSCEEDTDSSSVTVTADAGNDVTTGVGGQVELDGSGSSTSEGTLTYLWEFESTPSGSSVTIQNAATVNPSFTPDTEGDYNVKLTVSNGSNAASDNVTVTASADEAGTIEVSGEINSDETWTDHVSDPQTPDYIITDNVGLNAKLTIESNVLIHVKEDVGMWINSEGTIISNGQSGSEVVFTSSDEASGLHWKGILVFSSSAENKLEYTKLKYAGKSEFNHSGSNYAHALGVEGGKLSLLNSEISNSKAYGFFLHSGELNQFSTNSFSDNELYGIRINANEAGKLDNASTFSDPAKAVNIYGSTLSSSSDITWPDLNGSSRYYVSGWVHVESYLKIIPGAIFDFAEDKALEIKSNGVLVADASGSDQIVFTSKDGSSGIYWKGIWVKSNDSRNILSNVEVSYAGNTEWQFSGSNYPSAIGIENGKLTILSTDVLNSKGYGLYLHSGSLPDFSSNTFDGNNSDAMVMMMEEVGKVDEATTFTNNGWNGVSIYNSTLTSDATWKNLKDDAMYKAFEWIYTKAGLTLNPGVEIAFAEDKALIVQGSGYLSAKGTSANNILFTTTNLAGQIHWAGIWIQTSDARNEMDYVTVNYAGGYEFNYAGSNYSTAIAGDDDDNPTLTLTNSTVKNSASHAVYWEGGTINDVESAGANNTFTSNAANPDVVIP